jgi:hypothetical protein
VTNVESPPGFLQALNYNAEQTRRAVFAAFSGAGIIPSSSPQGGTPLALATVGGAVQLTVAGGAAMMPGNSTNKQGLYYGLNYASSTLSGVAADPSNPRVDMVAFTTDDAAYAGGANDCKLQIVKGTATPGATLANLSGAPALPANSTLVGYALLPAGATAYSSVTGVTTPIWATSSLAQPYYLAYNSAATTLNSGGFTQVTLGGTTASNYGCTISSNNVVVPVAGLYDVSYQVQLLSGISLAGVKIRQAASDVIVNSLSTGPAFSIAGSATLSCNAGDAIGLYAIASTGTPQTAAIASETFLDVVYRAPK